MVLDASALVAILEGEPEAERLMQAIVADPKRLISAATLVEAGIVIEARRGEAAGRELDLLLHRLRAEVVAVDAQQAEAARGAYRRFGKGVAAPGLNLGDTFTYALARASGEPVLALGTEFAEAGLAVVVR